MAKNWYIKFEYRVWQSDPHLSQCSLAARGFWLEILCAMHAQGVYEVSGTFEQIARLTRCDSSEVAKYALELKNTGTADVTLGNADVTLSNGNVTLISRRLQRELSSREKTRLRVQRHRSNSDVTLHSNSNSNSKEEEVLNNSSTISLADARRQSMSRDVNDSQLLNSAPPSSPSDPLLAEGEAPEQGVWRRGVSLLVKGGSTESSARSLLGKLIKTHGEETVAHGVTALELKNPFPADPKAFLVGCLKPKETSYTAVRNQPTQREAIREEQERIAREIANA